MTVPILSGLTPSISFVWDLYEEASVGLWDREEKLLALVAAGQLPGSEFYRFNYMTVDDIRHFFANAQDELSVLTVFNLLSAAEGHLRDDFEKRVENVGDSTCLSYDFRVIAEHCVRDRKKIPYSLGYLLDIWATYFPQAHQSIALFKSYWPFRNWLAHGRWTDVPSGCSIPPPDNVKNCVAMLNDLAIPSS